MFKRIFWLAVGFLTLGLAIAGAVLPLLPTTPFLLLATYAFARSSKRLHSWLLDHKIFGNLIKNWQRNGSIDRRTKLVSVTAMFAVLGVSWGLGVGSILLIVQAGVLLLAAAFVLSRPSVTQGKS
jgi:uncharacterized membrane protein YbaN (DUF454 family)